ncbi:MAG: flagellar biosynthetic protein FliR [Armatimonadota bacterium]|nr:flagellar biosynthetic protein FliR [Armatimonadota bacterium]
MDIGSIGVAQLEVFMLALARTAGIFTLAPIFGSSQVPVQVRVLVAVSIALVFVPLCASATPAPPAVDLLPMAALMIKEALVGLAVGFVTNLVFAAIQAAGDLIDIQSGFSFAAVLDPVYGSQTAIAGRVHHLLAGLLFFVTNAHHVLLAGLADSFRIIPVAELSLNPAAAGGALNLFAAFFAVALKIAAPVLAAVFLADVALAVISRGAPQMNVLFVGMPLKLGVGLVGMAIALPVMLAGSRDALGDIGYQIAAMARILALH